MFQVGERVICVDDSECEGLIVRGRSYVVLAVLPAGTVVARGGGWTATITEDNISIGICSLVWNPEVPRLGVTVFIDDVWQPQRFRRPQRLETRTALSELVGLVSTTREPVDA